MRSTVTTEDVQALGEEILEHLTVNQIRAVHVHYATEVNDI